MRALLAIADAAHGATLTRGLLAEGIDVAIETTFADARSRALHERFDALVADMALPGGGVELCRELRGRGLYLPVIMLSDSESPADCEGAREVKVDAFLHKPVSVCELATQLCATKRLARPEPPPSRIRVADLEIDLRLRVVHRSAQRVDLTSKEFALLDILARHAGQVVSRPVITAHVWPDATATRSNMLEVLVGRLRRKIDEGHGTRLVRTLRAAGYQLGPD
jgi:DNA-binding response OmpR family regulator